jgi:hypothetical protein
VLDGDQGVAPGEKQGVHVQEVHGQHRLSLGGEELAPGRTRPARRGTEKGDGTWRSSPAGYPWPIVHLIR